jgi:hypothetical protein
MMIRNSVAAGALIIVAACAGTPSPAADDSARGPDTAAGAAPGRDDGAPGGAGRATGDRNADSLALLRLEQEAEQLVRAGGCSTVEQCRTAPVGDRPCGGPRRHLVYCAASTDSAALYRKLEELAAAERSFNERYELVSTCELRMPPDTVLVAGECRAATPR